MDRMKSLLESYYGVSEDSLDGSQNDLDSPSFNVDQYVKDRLSQASFSEVLATDDALVQEIRTLDADMQLLVYDNYSKFISATDTIRSMKANVDVIEGEIETLAVRVEGIQKASTSINDRMGSKRSQIEKLLQLQNLINKLNFLFELPLRLEQCVKMDALSQAVFYFKRAVPILLKHSEVASFASIERESTQIMTELQTTLRASISKQDVEYGTFNENMKLLVELSSLDLGGHGKIERLELEELAKTFLKWHSVHMDEKLVTIESEQSKIALGAFVERMCSSVLEKLSDVCKLYSTIFMEHELVAGDEDAEQFFRSQLSGWAEPTLMGSFFGTIHNRLLDDDISLWTGNDDEPTKEDEEEGRSSGKHYRPLLAALHLFISRIKTFQLENVVSRKGMLFDRTTEISEHVIRKQVVLAFDVLKGRVADRLIHLCDSYENDDNKEEAEKMGDKNPLEFGEAIGKEIEQYISNTMVELNKLLEDSGELLAELASIFDNLVKFQLRYWFLWFASALECVVEPFHPARKNSVAISVTHPMNDERSKIQVEMPMRQQCPSHYILSLACMAQHMRRYIRKNPYQTAGAPEIMNELDSAKDFLLVKFVEGFARNVCLTIRPELESVQVEDPTGVRESSVEIVQSILNAAKLVTLCTQETKVLDRVHSMSSSVASSPNRGGLNSGGNHSRHLSAENVDMDIERMFGQKMKIVDKVLFSTQPICVGILKIVFKTFFECVRSCTISKQGFQQIEVDTYFLRSVLTIVLEDMNVVNSLLVQILSAARERCLDPVPMNQDRIDQFCHTTREKLRLDLNNIVFNPAIRVIWPS